MGKKKPYKVKNKDNVVVKWDDLVPVYQATSDSLSTAIAALHDTGKEFKAIIDGDKEISTTFLGISNVFADLTNELTGIAKMHCNVVENEDGKKQFLPYTGVVADKDEHKEVYLYTTMAYGGLNDKIEQAVENAMTTLLGAIREKVAILEKKGELNGNTEQE